MCLGAEFGVGRLVIAVLPDCRQVAHYVLLVDLLHLQQLMPQPTFDSIMGFVVHSFVISNDRFPETLSGTIVRPKLDPFRAE